MMQTVTIIVAVAIGFVCGGLWFYWPAYDRGWKKGFAEHKKIVRSVWTRGPVQDAIKKELMEEWEDGNRDRA